jgi:fumarate hydratase class II
MMPIIAHNVFEMMQVTIGSVRAFSEKCVAGLQVNRDKAAGWLDKNAIVVTALNPLIGYAAGATLVKEALASNVTIRAVALKKAKSGSLIHVMEDRPVKPEEIESALNNLRRLTEGGLVG